MQTPPLSSGLVAVALAMGAIAALLLRWRSSAQQPGVPLQELIARLPPPARIPALTNSLYTHGGSMGSAMSMLRDPVWRALFEAGASAGLLATLRAAAPHASSRSVPHLMSAMEDDPTLAAFGVHADLIARRARVAGSAAHNARIVEWDLYLNRAATVAAQRGELDLNRCVVAHGGVVDIVLERALGVDRTSSVLATGGHSIPAWLKSYERALESVQLESHAAARISVFLDIKSSHARPADLTRLIHALNACGVHVWGVGSFLHVQLPHAFPGPQMVAWKGAVTPLPPPLPIYLYASIHGVIEGVRTGALPYGSCVLTSGATMLEPGSVRVHDPTLRAMRQAVLTHGLQLGWYVQEPWLGPDAAAALVDVANAHADVLRLGFSYGNVDGLCEQPVREGHVMNGAPPMPLWLRLLAWSMSSRSSSAAAGEKKQS